MPDNLSQAAPETTEPTVPETTPATGSAQAVNAKPQTEPQKETTVPLSEVENLIRTVVQPMIQSQVAKGENRVTDKINKQIQEQFAALDKNKSVLNLSDEQISAARQKIVTDAYAQPQADPEPQNKRTESLSSEPTAQVDPVGMLNNQINAVFKVAGTTVTRNDPEYKDVQDAIDEAWKNDGPEGLVILQDGVMRAAKKKIEREAAQQEKAGARILNGGEQTPPSKHLGPDVSGHDLFTRAHEEKKK